MMFSGMNATGVYFNQLVDLADGAVSGVSEVIHNPIYLGITLVLLVLILVPGTDG